MATQPTAQTLPSLLFQPCSPTQATTSLVHLSSPPRTAAIPLFALFGFGPVTPEGFGIGYIIKDEGISICMSSKHLQTRRLLDTLSRYLLEVRGMLVHLWREANERPEAFVDHAGVLRDARTGKAITEEEAVEGQGGDEELRECGLSTELYV